VKWQREKLDSTTEQGYCACPHAARLITPTNFFRRCASGLAAAFKNRAAEQLGKGCANEPASIKAALDSCAFT
jgi:hypothetical protein